MTPAHRSGRRLGRTILLALVAIAVTVLVVIVVSGWPPTSKPPIANETGITSSPAPTARVDCTEETGPLALGLSGAACPSAILAVDLAVAPVRLPIDRIVIEPGPLFCDLLWPGVQTVPVCRGSAVIPGQFMHAWVSFTRSSKVAVVMLGLDLPEEIRVPGRTRPPWNTTLVTVEIPPDGWVMP